MMVQPDHLQSRGAVKSFDRAVIAVLVPGDVDQIACRPTQSPPPFQPQQSQSAQL